jgi:hypothetical protein
MAGQLDWIRANGQIPQLKWFRWSTTVPPGQSCHSWFWGFGKLEKDNGDMQHRVLAQDCCPVVAKEIRPISIIYWSFFGLSDGIGLYAELWTIPAVHCHPALTGISLAGMAKLTAQNALLYTRGGVTYAVITPCAFQILRVRAGGCFLASKAGPRGSK